VTSKSGELLIYYDPTKTYSDPGFQGAIYTTSSFGNGSKAFYVEWTANTQSATVMELLSEQLISEGQFSSTNCWPNCGEIDVYEMLLQGNTSSVAYGAPSNYGQTTLHKGDKASACNCASRGGSETWYQNTKPMVSSCSAQWQNRPNAKNTLVTIIDQDSTGQFVQLIQDPVITKNSDGSYDIAAGSSSLSSQKMYNDATSFYGTMPPSSCSQGDPDLRTGWPFFNQPMHLILWEQDYTKTPGEDTGEFTVNKIQIFVSGNGVTGGGGGTEGTGSTAGSNGPQGTNASKSLSVTLEPAWMNIVLLLVAAVRNFRGVW